MKLKNKLTYFLCMKEESVLGEDGCDLKEAVNFGAWAAIAA